MKKIILLTLISILSIDAYASRGRGHGCEEDRDLPNTVREGINAAAAVCQDFYYQSDKAACVQEVGRASYFTVAAVDVCKGHYYVSDRRACLGQIAGKIYYEFEVETCKNFYYVSDRVKCLAESGRQY